MVPRVPTTICDSLFYFDHWGCYCAGFGFGFGSTFIFSVGGGYLLGV